MKENMSVKDRTVQQDRGEWRKGRFGKKFEGHEPD